jgi:hypothetical protein
MAPYFRFNIPCATTTTTTTTTTTAPPCYCYTIIAENGSTTVSYSRCSDGATINLPIASTESGSVCSRDTPVYVSGATPYIFACTSVVNCTANIQCNNCT